MMRLLKGWWNPCWMWQGAELGMGFLWRSLLTSSSYFPVILRGYRFCADGRSEFTKDTMVYKLFLPTIYRPIEESHQRSKREYRTYPWWEKLDTVDFSWPWLPLGSPHPHLLNLNAKSIPMIHVDCLVLRIKITGSHTPTTTFLSKVQQRKILGY